MARTYGEYKAGAEAGLAKGFPTKQAKADALYFVSNSFDILMRQIRDVLLADGSDRKSKKWIAQYYTPASANWNAKRAAIYASRFPEQTAMANELATLRGQIKATELIAKAPSKARIAEQARLADAMTCQICGRPILAEVGVIAHHGYERPGMGWQTASCPGARELPFENDRAALGHRVAMVKKGIVDLKAYRKATAEEKNAIIWSFGRRGDRHEARYVTFTRATMAEAYFFATPAFSSWDFSSYDNSWRGNGDVAKNLFDLCLARELRHQAREIKGREDWVKWAQARYDGWGKTASWRAKDGREYWIRKGASQ